MKNITVEAFEHMTTARVLCERLIDRQTRGVRREFHYDELLTQALYAGNDILRDHGLNRVVWIRMRGNKAFLLSETTRTIIAELVIDGVKTHRDTFRRPIALLMDRKGCVRALTIADLIVRHDELRRKGAKK